MTVKLITCPACGASFTRRAAQSHVRRCLRCGKAIKRGKYCSPACRQAAYRARKELRTMVYQLTFTRPPRPGELSGPAPTTPETVDARSQAEATRIGKARAKERGWRFLDAWPVGEPADHSGTVQAVRAGIALFLGEPERPAGSNESPQND